MMKKWICAILCLSMVAGLSVVDVNASADRENNNGQSRTEESSPKPSPSTPPTAVPDTETPAVDTSATETGKPGQLLPPTQPPVFTGNKIVNDEHVFAVRDNADAKTCTIIGYNGDTGVTTLYIPKTIQKKTVTAVEGEVFVKCPFLKNVVVLANPAFDGTGMFAAGSGVELWGVAGGRVSVYAEANHFVFHPLDGPSEVSAKKADSLKAAALTWSDVTGAVSYTVCRKQGKGKYSVCKNLKEVSFVNDGLKPGAKYTYKVIPVFTAANGDSIEGLASKELAVSMTPAKLKKVKAYGIRGGIQLRWKRNKKASGYQVFMKVHVKGFKTKFNRVKTIKSNKTTGYRCKMLVRNMKYSYRVRQFVKVKGKKVYSPYVTVTAKAK